MKNGRIIVYCIICVFLYNKNSRVNDNYTGLKAD